VNLRSRTVRSIVVAALVAGLIRTTVFASPAEPEAPQAPARSGASLAEKIACVYLLIGGSIMLYYGPTERENGQVTRDGKSEAVAGAASIGISIALMRDIFKKRSSEKRQ
jgi:hypothetical protein